MHSYSRRDFLKTAGQAGLFCALPSLAHATSWEGADTVTISILHTTDLHGNILPTRDYDGNPDLGGFARCAEQIRHWRYKKRNTILIDVGDVYQGTDVALRDRGQLMVELLNSLRYDAWVIGNHEFDWGVEPFLKALRTSHMPVLATNTLLEGRAPLAGQIYQKKNPLTRIQPYIIKQIEGIRVAIIGVTTPGMPFWFRQEFLRGLEFEYPIEPVRRAIRQVKAEGVHAIVLAGHMGLKARTGGDDFANTVMALTAEFPDISVFIAGHTHQNVPERLTNGVLLTQSDHFGIHCGRVDLVFNRASKRLVRRQAYCERMDNRVEMNSRILSRAAGKLAVSANVLAQAVGELGDTFAPGKSETDAGDLARLIGVSIMEALAERGVHVDGAFHGLFNDTEPFTAGCKTIADVWQVLPYENFIVTAELTGDELRAIMEESYMTRERRDLVGFAVATEGVSVNRRITSLTREDGTPLERGQKLTVAFNTFDSRSGGHRFMKLRELLEAPAANCQFHPVQTRDALIDYFQRHPVVRRLPSRMLPAAA